jgi:hypothetical protein
VSTQVLVTWAYALHDNTGFLLQRSVDSASTWPNNYTTDDSTFQYIDSDVVIGGTYWYHVAATNPYGVGGFSNIASVYISGSGPVTLSLTIAAVFDSKPYDGTKISFQSPIIVSGSIVYGDTASYIQFFTNKLVGTDIPIDLSGSFTVTSGNAYDITLVPNAGDILGPSTSAPDYIFIPTDTNLPNDIGWSKSIKDITSGSSFMVFDYLPIENVTYALTSSDCINWGIAGSPSFSSRTIGYGMGRYVGLNYGGNFTDAQYSDDNGITWNMVSIPTSDIMYDVIYSGTKFVAVGYNGTVLTSSNGSDWGASNVGTSDFLNRIIYNGGRYVAVGFNISSPLTSTGTIYTSTDLETWAAVSSSVPTTAGYQAVDYSPSLGLYLAVGENGLMATSPDGVNWIDCSQPAIIVDSHLSGVAWNSVGLYFAVCDNKGYIFTSTDTINWTLVNIDPTPTFSYETRMNYYRSLNKFVILQESPPV